MSNELITVSSSEITGLNPVFSLGFFGAYKDGIVELAPGYFESSSSSESSASSESSSWSSKSSSQSSVSSDISISSGIYQCGSPVSFSGGVGTTSHTVNIGSDMGLVLFTFNAYYVPDRFVVTWDGLDVIDTGYRGSATLNPTLIGLGLPPVSGPGSGTATFFKNKASPSLLTVTVYGPITGTAWSFSVDCPS